MHGPKQRAAAICNRRAHCQRAVTRLMQKGHKNRSHKLCGIHSERRLIRKKKNNARVCHIWHLSLLIWGPASAAARRKRYNQHYTQHFPHTELAPDDLLTPNNGPLIIISSIAAWAIQRLRLRHIQTACV